MKTSKFLHMMLLEIRFLTQLNTKVITQNPRNICQRCKIQRFINKSKKTYSIVFSMRWSRENLEKVNKSTIYSKPTQRHFSLRKPPSQKKKQKKKESQNITVPFTGRVHQQYTLNHFRLYKKIITYMPIICTLWKQ